MYVCMYVGMYVYMYIYVVCMYISFSICCFSLCSTYLYIYNYKNSSHSIILSFAILYMYTGCEMIMSDVTGTRGL